MKNRTVPTDPFLYKYKIWDTVEKEYVYTCTNREDVYRTHVLYFHEWVYKDVGVWGSRYYDSAAPKTRKERDHRRYTIIDYFGDEIPFNELHEVYGDDSRWRRRLDGSYNDKKPDVRYKKGNPNKIKRGYHNGSWWDDPSDQYYHYPYATVGWSRNFKTFQERKRNAADAAEYGNEIVRGRRRRSNLPEPWDDLYNSTCRSLDSWKTHSKRRKQWKPNI